MVQTSRPAVLKTHMSVESVHKIFKLAFCSIWKNKLQCFVKLISEEILSNRSNIVEEPGFKNIKNKHLGMPFLAEFSLVLTFST